MIGNKLENLKLKQKATKDAKKKVTTSNIRKRKKEIL